MSYLSCDMSYKISANGSAHSTGKNSSQYNRGPRNNHKGIKGYMQYLAREIDVREGREVYGYHDSIDTNRTKDNITWFRDADGKYKRCMSVDDLQGAFERRIEDVEVKRHLNGKTVTLKGQKALKSNSCVLRPIVIQAEGHEDNQFFIDAVSVLGQRVGMENIVGFSIHRDEKSTHCHVLVVPVKEHSLDQQKVLPNTGKKMEKFHESMRMSMRKKYKDISLENKPGTYKNENGKTEDLTQEQRTLHEDIQTLVSDFKEFQDLEDVLNNMWKTLEREDDSEFIRIAKAHKDSNGMSVYDKIKTVFKNEQRKNLTDRRYTPERIQSILDRMSEYEEDEEQYTGCQ